MATSFSRLFRHTDLALVGLVSLLILLGIMTIYSSTFTDTADGLLRYQRQLLFLAVGLVIAGAVWLLNLQTIKKAVPLLYLFQVVLLILVLFVGVEVNGAKAWFRIGTFGVQPVEIAKLITILALGKYFSEHYYEMHRFRHVVVSGLYVMVPLFLVLLQPDLGSALVFIAIWLGMLFVSNVRLRHFIIVLTVAIAVLLSSWFTFLQDYQKDRIRCLVQIEENAAVCYNVQQALIAVGSGGVFGKGFGHGSQSQLNFLPEKDTDFIFAVIAEELGIAGAMIVLVLFSLLLYRLLSVARNSGQTFSRLIVLGFVFLIGAHIVINVGTNVGLFPVAGIPLPFVSYGGSMMINMLLAIGIVLGIVRVNREQSPIPG